MKTKNRSFAVFTAFLGIIALFLTLALHDERPHDGHLPGREGRAETGVYAIPWLITGFAVFLTATGVPGEDRIVSRDNHIATKFPEKPCCPLFLSSHPHHHVPWGEYLP